MLKRMLGEQDEIRQYIRSCYIQVRKINRECADTKPVTNID